MSIGKFDKFTNISNFMGVPQKFKCNGCGMEIDAEDGTILDKHFNTCEISKYKLKLAIKNKKI